MATNFNPATKISVSGPLSISDKRSADMPLDIRGRIETLTDITTIPFAWEGMLVYVRDTKKYYKVTSLANRTVGGVAIPYYPATWVEFGSGGSTPSPTPSDIDAGDVSYFSSGTFSNNTVGKELQSLASDILGLAEDIHNLSGDIGTLSNLNTENKQDLVVAINEVLASTGSTIAVVDNLASNSTTDALSAYQGKVLKGLVDGKVAGIKVQGESSILPMDSNGIVTIPAGGGGTGTITGATVGGKPVTESGGILQFDAYPTIPDAPTANTMLYSDADSYTSGSIGKALKDARADIKTMYRDLHPVEQQDPTPISPTTVDLDNYDETDDSFTYSDDTIYVYGVSNTSKVVYNDNGADYAVFKVNDVDKYIRYEITESEGTITYTCEDSYTLATLPSEARSLFEISKYAAVKVITGTKTDWFYKGRYTVFVDSDNRPMQNDFYEATESDTTVNYALFKSNSNGDLYLYKLFTLYYKFQSKITSSDANYATYDAHFGASSADKVSFDDSLTELGTQLDPVDNVQKAINVLTTAIASNTCIFTVTLKDYNATALSSKTLTVTYSLNGASTTLSNIVTDSNGKCIFTIPYGATYSITYPSITNRLTPEPSTGIATIPHTILQRAYQEYADNEQLLLNVLVRNVSTVDYNPNGKKVYIYYKISDNWNEDPDITITLNNTGQIATNGVKYKNVETLSSTCFIPRGTQYKVVLQEWNTEISSELQDFIKSTDRQYTANSYTRVHSAFYYYKKAGIFLCIEDFDGNTDLNTWTEYRCIEVDTTNWIATIHSDSDNKDYNIKYDSTYGLMRLDLSDSNAIWEEWYAPSKINRVLGVGFRTSTLIDNSVRDQTYINNGFETCAFIVPADVTIKNGIMHSINGIWPNYPNDEISGKAITTFMLNSTNPTSELSVTINAITKKIGSFTQNAFIASYEQLSLLRTNRDVLVTLLKCCNNNSLSSTSPQIVLNSSNQNLQNSTLMKYVALTGSTDIQVGFKYNNSKTIPVFAI